MKAKTILGLIACVGACATFSAFGNTDAPLFGIGVQGTVIGGDNCTVTPNGAEVVEGKIAIDNDSTSAFTIDQITEWPLNDGLVAIKGIASLTPSDTNDFEIIQGAKAGFAVGIDGEGHTNFYGYANGNDEWVKLTGTPGVGTTNFAIVLDYRFSKVSFCLIPAGQMYTDIQALVPLKSAADNTTSKFDLALGEGDSRVTKVLGVDAFGSGTIESIFGSYEVARAEYNGVKYGSLVEAITAAGEGGAAAVGCVNTNGSVSTGTCANGLQAWECAALGIAPSETLKFEPADPANMVSDKITLKAELDHMTILSVYSPDYDMTIETKTEPDPDFNVEYDVYQGATRINGGYPADAVKIPMGTGSYTVKPVITPKQ